MFSLAAVAIKSCINFIVVVLVFLVVKKKSMMNIIYRVSAYIAESFPLIVT